MAYLRGPKEKRSRAVGENLFLKTERSTTSKSAYLRRSYRPGMHGKRRRTRSEFGTQLIEKQKLRLIYGLKEQQLRRYVEDARRKKLVTAEALGRNLEARLDSTVFRMGLAPSRSIARFLVSHGHFAINSMKVTIPSRQVRPGDIISMRLSDRNAKLVEQIRQHIKRYEPPAWLSLEKEKLVGKVLRWPSREDIKISQNLNLIIEFYSK